ncbi:hypothetical protein JHK85_028032 [Glycine max]|nr:hypothetical protein JHK85_028032 [Glycine max]KAG5003371.1 hypothetical protein JHK86_027510 [Glycine max]
MAEPSSDVATTSATRKNKTDPGWKYCHPLVEGETNTIVCNFCGKITKGGITRAKQHLIGKSGNIASCKKTPPNVVEELKEYMTTKKSGTTYSTSGSGNMTNIRDFEFGEPVGCDGSEDDEFADSCNATASAKTKCGTKKGPMDKFCKNPENAINQRKMEMLRQMNIRDGLSFNLIKLKSFENMVAAIRQYEPHLPIPSYHDIRVPLLKKKVEYTKNLMKGHREQWVKYGFGIMFLKFVDGFDFLKTNEKIFELLDAIVEEVGEENAVQVVTDNGSNYVLAGKLLEEKRKHIYWTPGATYCIDLMLEDIGKLPLIRKTIRREINLVGFIYAHSSTLSLLRNFINKRELVRHAITRFATSYLTLERLHKEKANIRKMFTSDEWTLNKLSKEPKGKEATKECRMYTRRKKQRLRGLECRMYTRRKKQKTTSAAAAETSKKQAMVVGSSSRKQKAVQENDEDLDFEENIDLESEEEEIMINFETFDGEEGEGDTPLPYDNNDDDYVGIGEDD